MSRLREGRANTARGAAHFLRETVGRVRYGGARGQLTVRADSGFYAHTVVAACPEMDVRFSITIRQRASLRDLIEAIPEEDWTPIPYWMDGAADVAETTYTPFQTKPDAAPVRLIVRRVKPIYYKKGAGPMFDMGPYYLTALIALLGPIRRVSGSHGSGFAERTITSAPLSGQTVEVEVPTHVAGVLDFQNGAIGTIVTSFDVWASRAPRIEIYGTEGTLSVPDPNNFGGPVVLQRGRDEWREVSLTHPEGG